MMLRLLTFVSVLFAFSCVKDKPPVAAKSDVQLAPGARVYVVNEGNFYGNNASVSLYDPASAQVVADYYGSRNNSALGDVAQSITMVNGQYHIVVNNSGKIVVCDNEFRKLNEYHGFSSPRYLLPVSNRKAYVSDYNANAISVLDLNSGQREAVIPCAGWTEKMVKIYHKVFVTNMKRPFLYVINSIDDKITDSIEVGKGAGNIVTDRFDKVWLLVSGEGGSSDKAQLLRIDPVTNAIETSFEVPAGQSPGSLCMNRGLDTLYYLNAGVFRLPVNAGALPGSAFVAQGHRNFYGLGVSSRDYHVYVSDALDYLQASSIYIYDQQGKELTHFKAGINANGFYFE